MHLNPTAPTVSSYGSVPFFPLPLAWLTNLIFSSFLIFSSLFFKEKSISLLIRRHALGTYFAKCIFPDCNLRIKLQIEIVLYFITHQVFLFLLRFVCPWRHNLEWQPFSWVLIKPYTSTGWPVACIENISSLIFENKNLNSEW